MTPKFKGRLEASLLAGQKYKVYKVQDTLGLLPKSLRKFVDKAVLTMGIECSDLHTLMERLEGQLYECTKELDDCIMGE